MSGNVYLIPVQCALEMWPGWVGQCNAAHALTGSIQSAHYSPFLDSELLAALTPGTALPATSLLFLEILHLPAL